MPFYDQIKLIKHLKFISSIKNKKTYLYSFFFKYLFPRVIFSYSPDFNLLRTDDEDIINAVFFSYFFLFSSIFKTNQKNIKFINLFLLLKSNTKQFLLSILGFDKHYFSTVSTGKLLSRIGLLTKSLKKSPKSNKYLFDYINYFINSNSGFSHVFMKPINRKNINFFNEFIVLHKIKYFYLGYKNYYKTTFKHVHRIKKKIKKKINKTNIFYC